MGGGGSSNTTAQIPSFLQPLYKQTADMMMGYQTSNPLGGAPSWLSAQGWGNPYAQGGDPAAGGGADPAAGGADQQGAGAKRFSTVDASGAPINDAEILERQYQRQQGAGGPEVAGGWLGTGGGGGMTQDGRYTAANQGGPMHGGDYGFGGPNALRVAGANALQENAARGVEWMQKNNNPWRDQATQSANQLGNRSDSMFGNKGREAGQGYNAATGALGTANRMANGGMNPYGSRSAEGFENVHEQGQQKVTGDMISGDPVLAAQQKAFELTAKPMINNQMGAMGLGRSGAAGQAMSDAWAKSATPLMQEAAAREERGIDRGIQATNAASSGMASLGNQYNQQQQAGLQGQLGAAGALTDQWGQRINQWNSANNAEQAAGSLNSQIGQNWFNNNTSNLDREFGWGGQFRDIEQQGNQAQMDDFVRRMGLAENAVYTPFGQLGNTIGQTSSGGGK